MSAVLLVLCLALAPHGGQYVPPVPDEALPESVGEIVTQPGLGPQLTFESTRWEWWFDFNQEPLLALRSRMPVRALKKGAAYDLLTDDDRGSIVLPVLVDALRDRPPAPSGGIRKAFNTRDVRAAAVLSLGRLHRADAVPYIELVLEDDPDLFVRTQAVLALGFAGSAQGVETLTRLFRDPKQSAEIRTYAVTGLGLIANTEAVDVLAAALTEKALKDVNNQLRAAVLYAAGLSRAPVLGAALRALDKSWLFQKEPAVRALVAFALGRIDDPASVPFLLGQLSDSDNQVRRSAASALAASTARLDGRSVDRLVAQYDRDADLPAKVDILRALGTAGLDASRAFLRGELGRASYEYRPHVALALAVDGHFQNAEPLLEALGREREASVQAALALSLGLLRSPEAIEPTLAIFATARDPQLVSWLCLALGLQDPDQGELAARFEDLARTSADVEVVRSAIIGLGLLGERGRLASLADGLGRIPGLVPRASVAHGLGLVGDRSILPQLIAVVRDENQPAYVRAYVLQALGELSDPRELSPCWVLSSQVEMNLDVGFLFELYRVL